MTNSTKAAKTAGPIWQRPATLEAIHANHHDTICEHLGIEFVEVGDDYLVARMPADRRTRQPMGIVHGGASVTLAETLGSVGANLCLAPPQAAVGLDINANHIRSVRDGWVTGRAHPVHLGRTTQVWQIEMRDDAGRLTCTSRLTMAVIARPA
ncbi:MAG: hotdog fold thioesterase [Burkholderiaceae bacterium]